MRRRARNPRRLFHATVMVGAMLGTLWAIACNDNPLINTDSSCAGIACECVKDPQQPLCKGYNDRPEAGPFEGSFPDVVVPDEASEEASVPDASDEDASD